MSEKEQVNLSLGRDEALVLFEMLSDFQYQPFLEIKSSAERLSLIRLSGALESLLTELLAHDYEAVVHAAQSRLIEQFGNQDP